jgi:hypothetical protein
LAHTLIALYVATALAAPSAADEHLLAGAKAFRAGRYADALVEFKVAEKLGAGADARSYAAATLVKLDRPEDALEVFGLVQTTDAVTEFYRALACYQARLFVCADRLLEASMARFGPRVATEAAALRTEIQKTLIGELKPTTIDWYLSRAETSLKSSQLVLAELFSAEARALAGRMPQCHRCAEAEALTAKAKAAAAGEAQR